MALTNKLQAIADAIRKKTGKTDTLTLDAMVTEIEGMSGGGSGALVFDDDGNVTGSISAVPDYYFYRTPSDTSAAIGLAIKTLKLDKAETVGNSAFNYCSSLTSIDLPACTTVGTYGFKGSVFRSLYLPACTSVGASAFHYLSQLQTVNLPKLTVIPDKGGISSNVYGCFASSGIKSIDLGVCTRVGTYAFYYCKSLTAVILRSETMATLASTDAFKDSTISAGTGYIYVPDALVDSYKTATNWVTYADQIKPLSELPTEA